jgi:hypothetical protein
MKERIRAAFYIGGFRQIHILLVKKATIYFSIDLVQYTRTTNTSVMHDRKLYKTIVGICICID